MSSAQYMAHHQLRLPPPSSSSVAVLLTFAHLICHIASISPSSANQLADTYNPNASHTQAQAAAEEKGRLRNSSNPSSMLIITNDDEDVEESFKEYQETFKVTLNEGVDFVRGEGLSTLLWQAENPKYSTVLYVLSRKNSSDAGLCDMSTSMSQSFNKTIIIWPCPKMKRTETSSLPSYETVSFAVKSISQEFNWTEAVIFVAGTNWGLPLAIAANLHVPYRIELNHSYVGQIEDKLGAVVIVTSPVNSVDSRRLLHEFRSFSYTKVLVIDITGSIFSRSNHFSGYLATKEELDFVVEHWSENNFYSTSRTTNTPLPVSGQQNGTPHNNHNHRYKRSSSSSAVEEDPPLVRQQPKAAKVQSERKGRETVKEGAEDGNSSNRQESKTTPEGTDQKVVVVDPKPQNFLILTVFTDKLKTLHDRALHVEFEQHYKLSRSGVMEPFRGNGQGATTAISSGPNGDAEDPYQLQRRKQMKRSEEIIVTVNGTRNCNTTTTATPDQHAATASLKASATHAGNGPKSGDSAEDDCVKNKREDADEDNLRNGADEDKGRLLISKLPIFTSLTSSINESIQLLLVYAGQSNCSLSSGDGGLEAAVQECVSALKCARVSDGNEQLFCHYLCRSVVNHSYNRESETSEPKTDPTVDTVTSPALLQGDSERFSTVSDMVVAMERVCRSMEVSEEVVEEELSLRNESSGEGGVAIQMQFSENLLYFYNENVVSKNNELVKRHKSKPMPNQSQQPHYPAKDYSFRPNPHRVLKRSVEGVKEASSPEEKIARLVAGSSMVDKRLSGINAAADEPDLKVTDDKDDAGHHPNESATAASHYAKYSEYFSLFDYIVATTLATNWNASGPALRVDFIILDFQSVITSNDVDDVQNATELGWRPFLIMQQSAVNPRLFTTHSILPGYNDWTLIPTQNFMECGLLCIGVIALAIAILCSIFVGGIVSAITIRKYLLRKRLSKGPNKVVLSPVDFVFPVDSRRVDEGIEAMLCCFLQQLQEFGGPEVDKPDGIKGSLSSLKTAGLPATQNKNNTSGSGSLARHNTVLDMRARYNGDLVQLKEISMLAGTELKTKAMDLLVMSHGLRHENINPFIGWLSDSTRTAMVFEYCSRGSLQDVLIMDDIKLDWSFRLSLLTDLVRGMRYLHSSPMRIHGGLTSRNCIVDARWVLKITDYGMSSFYDTIGITPPTKSAKELLWTAPEALRNTKGFPKCGTQMGDVYSFGIIMQEVVVRGEPYCMLSLSPEEIIQKIKKPPPLIRPSVSKGAAPPEAINIMRQCWAEMPDMRPDFNTVYERFKQLNHGRKVNFVDTMFQMLEKYSNNLEELIRERTDQLDMERKKTEQLLNRMLPTTVAEKLKVGLGVEPEEFSEVTIYFSDIVGFTTIAAHCSPVQVVDLLNDLYTCFDATINAYNVYKVETIGDAYMVVSGLPSRIPDHAEQIATMALDLLHESGRFQVKHLPGVPLQLRIGLHSGPCCAGVVGLTMPRYCLFGDTVNTASRMESTGSSWRIHLSESTRDRLVRAGGYNIDSRGLIEIKGKGLMNTYWLLGKKGFDKPLPDPPPIGLDESLIRNSIKTSQLITELSSDHSESSVVVPFRSLKSDATVEVKVEITPPAMSTAEQQSHPLQQTLLTDPSSPVIATALSLDSSPANQATLNTYSQQDFPPRASVSLASPQQRKLSEFSQDSLLNPNGFTRMTPSPGANSSRLFKKIEEMMDLSSPYNHYRCLSSDSNLVQCGGHMMGIGSALQNLATLGGNLSVPSPAVPATFTSLTIPEQQTADGKLNSSVGGGVVVQGGFGESVSRPGSGRLLRRQFSLDKDDVNNNSSTTGRGALSNNLGNSACGRGGGGGNVGTVKSYAEPVVLPVETYQKHSSLPSISGQTLISNNNNVKTNRTPLFKHNSSSISQDLEKIEEIPGSPNPAFQTQHRSNTVANHHHNSTAVVGLYSQSSLTNSIPFIDGSSCSSSVSTIPSSIAPASIGGNHKPLEKDLRQSQDLESGTLRGDEDEMGVIVERREMNLNVDPLLLR